MTTLHYTAGNNFNAQGAYAPAAAGFNLADVSSVDQLNALPAGVLGMVYLDQGDGVTQSFIDAVKPYIGNPKVYGFYLKDEPDPTGQYNTLVTAENLKAESDYIHANVPGAKTFITMMNMGPSDDPTFADTYNPANTHIDLFGIDPYPVRSGTSTVDYGMIDKAVAAAESAGIPTSQIVPVFQTFGGGNWVNDEGGRYVMPTAEQAQSMLAHWSALVPNPAFDYAYSWGSQNGDTALESSPELQSIFLQHNTASATLPAEGPGAITTEISGESAIPPTDLSGDTTTASTGGAHTAADGATVDGGGTSSSSSVSPPSGSASTTIEGGQYHQHHQYRQHHQQQHDIGTSTTLSADGTSGGSTPTITDGGQYHRHQYFDDHRALDFSQLAVDGTGSAAGNHPVFPAPSAAAVGSGATAAASTALDVGAHLVDFHSDHYNSHHIDHHAWHL